MIIYRVRAQTTSSILRPVPPPPPKNQQIWDQSSHITSKDNKPLILRADGSSSPKPPPPDRGDRDSRKRDKKHRKHKHSKKNERDSSQSSHRKKKSNKHASSQSEDIGGLVEKKRIKISHRSKRHKDKTQSIDVEVVDFVPINKNYGRSSPTASSSKTLLDHLNELELDAETPSDEESLIYVREDDELFRKDYDPDIEVSYDWNARKPKSSTKKKYVF